MQRSFVLPAAILAALVAGHGRLDAAESPAPVYTNQDLERFGPPAPAPASPIVVFDDGWVSVQQFLDREFARIDAERRHSLDLKESDRQDRTVDALTPGYDSSWYPWYPAGGYWPYGWGGSWDTGCAPGAGRGYATYGSSWSFGVAGRHGSGTRTEHYANRHAAGARAGSERQRAFLDSRQPLYSAPRVAHPGAAKGNRHHRR